MNLIGDHIDYMGGTVLPMAIDRERTSGCTSAVIVRWSPRRRTSPRWGRWSPTSTPRPFSSSGTGSTTWSRSLRRSGHAGSMSPVWRSGSGEHPNGAGLSSSASLELAMAVALNAVTGAGLDATELALIGQAAENEFIGVACGIMDQLAIAAGVEGHAVAIDCATLQVTPIPFPDDVAVIVANTNQRRELADSGYNQRRAACERAQALLGQPLVAVPLDRVAEAVASLPEELRAHATRHHRAGPRARLRECAARARSGGDG